MSLTDSPPTSSPDLAPPSREILAWRDEPKWKHWTFLIIALLAAVGYTFFLFGFLAPGPDRPGIDENAYLVAGKNLAQHFTTGFKPADDYQFVGAMWLRTKDGWYYPKYPFGLPLINALTVLLHHREWAFAVSPLCTSLALLGIFFLAREMLGSFYALLGMIVLAMGPTTLQLAIEPNSHAPALCAVVWGMFFLYRWWQGGSWQLGVLAGLLLGFAVTIRYTEALLLFPLYSFDVVKSDNFIGPKLIPILKVLGLVPIGPLGLAVIWRMQWKNWRSWWRSLLPIGAWALPVGTMLAYNWFSTGHFTGYDATNESSGFSIDNILRKWDFTIYQLYMFGLFVLAPLGIAGLLLMYRCGWRRGLLFTMWFVPGTLLYTAYYWGTNMPSIGYLRFFLTLFPPLIIGAMWTLRSIDNPLAPIAAGILVAYAASVGLNGSLPELDRQHRGNMNLHYSAERIMSHAKSSPQNRPIIFADTGMFPQLLQYMQFMFDADWYPDDTFDPHAGGGFGLAGMFQNTKDTSSPVTLQADRIEYMDKFRNSKSNEDYAGDEHKLLADALNQNRKIYAVLNAAEIPHFQQRFGGGDFQLVQIERWVEPCAITFPNPNDHQWLNLPTWQAEKVIPWLPQARTMFEIRRRSTTQPAMNSSR